LSLRCPGRPPGSIVAWSCLGRATGMNQWPQRMPPDLQDRITRAIGMRGCPPNDVWAEVREWLMQHQVPVPHRLPDDPAPCGRDGSVG
jgi:hypothetical protein